MATNTEVNLKLNVDMASMKDLRSEFKSLQTQMSAAGKAGDTELFKKLQQAAAELKGDMQDAAVQMKALDPGEMLNNYVKLAQGITGAFALGTAAATVFGAEQETINEIQKQSTVIIQAMMGAEQLRATFLDPAGKAQLKATYAQTKALIAQAAAWAAANPYAAAALAIAAGLTAAYLLLSDSQVELKKQTEGVAAATLESDKKMADLEATTKNLDTQLGILDGTMTELQGTIETINEAFASGVETEFEASQKLIRQSIDDTGTKLKEAANGVKPAMAKMLKDVKDNGAAVALSYDDALQKLKDEFTILGKTPTATQTTMLENLATLYTQYTENIVTLEEIKNKKIAIATKKDAADRAKAIKELPGAYELITKKISELTTSILNLKAADKTVPAVMESELGYWQRKKDAIDGVASSLTKITTIVPGNNLPTTLPEAVRDPVMAAKIEKARLLEGDKEYERLSTQTKMDALLEQQANNTTAWEMEQIGYEDYASQRLTLDEQIAAEQIRLDNEVTQNRLAGIQAIMDLTNAVGNTTEQLMANELAQVGEDEAKKKAIKKKYAIIDLTLKSVATVASMAGAIAKGFEQLGPIAGAISAVTLAVEGIGLLATITGGIAQINAMATGGYVSGPGSGTSDSIPTMLSNGESVINARSTQAYAPLLSAINVAGGGVPFMAEGGIAGSKIKADLQNQMISSQIGDQKVYVLESDITSIQRRVSVNESRGRF